MPSLEEVGLRQVDIYHGFDELEPGTIDCDLGGRTDRPFTFENLKQVRNVMENELSDMPKDIPPIIEARYLGSIAYIRALSGEEIPYPEYIEATMGMKPEMVPESDLEARKVELRERIKDQGFKWFRSNAKDYKEAVAIPFDENFERKMMAIGARAMASLKEFSDEPIDETPPIISNVDEPWRAGVITNDDNEPVLEVNIFPDITWTEAKIAETYMHEPWHRNNLLNIKRRIAAGQLNPALQVTTLHTVEVTAMETGAQAASIMGLSESDSPAYTFHGLYIPFVQEVLSNARYMMNTDADPVAIAKYVKRHMPLDIEGGDIRKELIDNRDYIPNRAYHAAYGLGIKLADPILDLPKAGKKNVMNMLLDSFPLPSEIEKEVKLQQDLVSY